MESLKTALAIKSLYIFHHVLGFSIGEIGVQPDERHDAIIKATHHPGSNSEVKEIEHEIYKLMVKYFV